MTESPSSETNPENDFGDHSELSTAAYARRGLLPGLIAGLVIGPCTTFVPFLFFGGQAVDSFAFLLVNGFICLVGLCLGPLNGAVGGAVGGYVSSRFNGINAARIGGVAGGIVLTTVINVVLVGIIIATNFI